MVGHVPRAISISHCGRILQAICRKEIEFLANRFLKGRYKIREVRNWFSKGRVINKQKTVARKHSRMIQILRNPRTYSSADDSQYTVCEALMDSVTRYYIHKQKCSFVPKRSQTLSSSMNVLPNHVVIWLCCTCMYVCLNVRLRYSS